VLPVDHPRAPFKERLNKRQKGCRGVVTRALPSKIEACTETLAVHADCAQSAVINQAGRVDLRLNDFGKYLCVYKIHIPR